MKHSMLFHDDYLNFDTMSDGKSSAELFDQLVDSTLESLNKLDQDAQATYNASSVFGRKAKTALAAFEALGLVDSVSKRSLDGTISLAGIQQFVDRFDRPEDAKAIVDDDGSAGSDEVALGVGGFSTYIFSKLFLARLQVADGILRTSGEKALSVNGGDCSKVTGKIRDHIFIANPNDSKKGSGYLSVDMLFEIDKKDERESLFYHWDIDVRKYTVHERDDSRFPDFPFPMLQGNPDESGNLTEEPKVVFPTSSTDPRNPLSVWARGLNHKLFAEGGKDAYGKDNFTIENIFESRNGGPLRRLESEGAGQHPWYVVTEESCIDLMFKGYPPAAGLPPQANYCLGRCKHPKIVNTCGG